MKPDSSGFPTKRQLAQVAMENFSSPGVLRLSPDEREDVGYSVGPNEVEGLINRRHRMVAALGRLNAHAVTEPGELAERIEFEPPTGGVVAVDRLSPEQNAIRPSQIEVGRAAIPQARAALHGAQHKDS